ncbi:MAG: NHLP family bacteriocin export ABC transporter peptidase/permease/ATPase subunit [Dehalococcoidia bacterium]
MQPPAPPAGGEPSRNAQGSRPRPAYRRVKTPTVLQMEAVECGAAALGIVLSYFGKVVPLEELRAACGVSRDGSNALNMVKAARAYGLVAKGFREEVNDLLALRPPMIVFWGFGHFVVVEGFGRDRVYLNDPAVGPRTVSYDEFDKAYTGIALTFEPGPDFRKGGERRGLLPALASRLRGSWTGLIYCVLVGLALVVPGLAVPVFSKIFVDNYLISRQTGWVLPLLEGMALAAVLLALLTYLQQRYLLRLSTKLSLTMSSRFLWHVLRLPMEFYTQRYGGEIGYRVSLNDRVAQLLSGQLATALLNVVTVIFYLGLMFYYDVLLTLVGIGFALLNVVALRYVARRRIDVNQRLLQEQGKQMGAAMAGLQMIETVKATGEEADFFSRWAGAQAKVLDARQELAMPTQVLSAVPSLLSLLNMTAILTLGGLRVMEGAITVGTLVAFQSLMISFTQPITTFVLLSTSLQEIQGTVNRLDDVLRYPPDQSIAAAPMADETGASPKLAGGLELRNVTFGYSRLDPPLIENFNLTVQPGQRVAVVGATGSGKSTIARLVCGLYTPWSGDVLFDGKPRTAYPRDVVGNSLGWVEQEIFLFEGTVSDNLTLWDSLISKDQISRASRDACVHDVILARPGGYESHVEEDGRNFSGGERQRLEIARALTRDPVLLVLDEATSALDTIVEEQIDLSLRRRGCTCLIVAHRLSTIRDSDEIIVLDNGKVVQRGTHDDMKNVDGPYARLIAG